MGGAGGQTEMVPILARCAHTDSSMQRARSNAASSVPALPLSSSDSSSIGSSFRAQTGSSYRTAHQVKGAFKKQNKTQGPLKVKGVKKANATGLL